MAKILHYIYDPLCGWCYAAEALVQAAAQSLPAGVAMQMHGGGLFARTHLPESKRAHIRAADGHIAALTGQIFDASYLQGLLSDPATIYDSAPPIRAILAAEAAQPGAAPAMLKALQRAHYRQGRRIVEKDTIVQLAASLGIDQARFESSYDAITESDLASHLYATHQLMAATGSSGYPSFIAQVGQDFYRIPHERFYGNPDGFAAAVAGKLGPAV